MLLIKQKAMHLARICKIGTRNKKSIKRKKESLRRRGASLLCCGATNSYLNVDFSRGFGSSERTLVWNALHIPSLERRRQLQERVDCVQSRSTLITMSIYWMSRTLFTPTRIFFFDLNTFSINRILLVAL